MGQLRSSSLGDRSVPSSLDTKRPHPAQIVFTGMFGANKDLGTAGKCRTDKLIWRAEYLLRRTAGFKGGTSCVSFTGGFCSLETISQDSHGMKWVCPVLVLCFILTSDST